MDEAARRLHSAHVLTLARWLAQKAVKADWRSMGLKVCNFRSVDIARAADEWLEGHPELFEQARLLCAQINNAAQNKKTPKDEHMCCAEVTNKMDAP